MWIQRVSWIGLILALAGFVAGLGIHLATFAGINARLVVPEIVQVVVILYYPAFATFIGLPLLGSYIRRKEGRPLPGWLGTIVTLLLLLGAAYAALNLVMTFFPSDALTDGERQLRYLRNDSASWMIFYFLAALVITRYGLGREFVFGFRKSAQLMSR